MNILLILFGKLLASIGHFLNLGSGSTWPGHIGLSINKNFIKDIIKANPQLKIILVAGTNGKTTTVKLIRTILEQNGKEVFQNESGANLLNGIASTLIHQCNEVGIIDKNFGILEIDENTLPLILKQLTADYIILLNLFRDQLDRYGEVNTIAIKWKSALNKLSSHAKLILNADDPQVAFLGEKSKTHVLYFGINSKNKTEKVQHASDSTYCPNCGKKLTYSLIYFSHLGDWECKKCGYKHPKEIFTKSPLYPLVGIYNEYNTNAAALLTKTIGINDKKISSALHEFKPAFGRQEDLEINGKKVKIFLSKNPTSFNESLRTISDLGAKSLLIVLNDRIPDGRDVSWIWDVDFEEMDKHRSVSVAGDRTYDMALRLKYADMPIKDEQIYTDLEKASSENLKNLKKNETLYILPTYSAMLEVRKILTGRKIL